MMIEQSKHQDWQKEELEKQRTIWLSQQVLFACCLRAYD
jgi:hypothetical protein